jgi:DNA-binding transcriptional LysR family regulator
MQRRSGLIGRLAWDDVRIFLALCRARTVTKAAAALRVDGSTVSRRLAALEETLSTTLFERGRDGITATPAAEDLMPVAEEIEEAMARFASEAEALERVASGLVRIACPPDVAEVVVAPLVSRLHSKHPALRVEIDPGETVLDLTRREADIALRTVRPVRGDLVVTRLLTLRWVLLAGPQLARSLGTLRSWVDAPWIGWGERLSSIAPARWLAVHAPDVEPVVRCDSLMLQLALLRKGAGVALAPEPSAQHYGLVPVKIGSVLRERAGAWPTDDLFLVTHRALRQVPRVRVVWDLLIAAHGDRRVSG